MMDDTPPVAHISSDNEDDESAKNPSAKGSEVRQRGCVYIFHNLKRTKINRPSFTPPVNLNLKRVVLLAYHTAFFL